MAIPKIFPLLLGLLAALSTVAILTLHVILSCSLSGAARSVRTASILSAVLEALVLILIGWFLLSYSGRAHSIHGGKDFTNIWFASALVLCTVAASSSVAAVICLSNASSALSDRILGSTVIGLLVGSSVALGISFATQLIFCVVHFILRRVHCCDVGPLVRPSGEQRQSPPSQVKSVPYHETTATPPKTGRGVFMDAKSPPGSSGGRSANETISSIRTSLSHVVRPTSSRTRLLPGSQRSSRRGTSWDSTSQQERNSVTDDGFDSWDTSAVDPQNRQTVLETALSPTAGRLLETIPASPTTSRSPSPGTPLDLEPPRTRRRSRSYSPASQSSRKTQQPGFNQASTSGESHIHPLFRSDSPTPPPAATPGTVVTAAPNAGQVISDRQSIRTLTRMRSGSLPVTPSPLSRQGSFDDCLREPGRAEVEGIPDNGLADREAGEETERKMTPPIPDWILSAGSRTSLSDYQSRKIRSTVGQAHEFAQGKS
ncbi:hypothetical protein VTK73DRAFT_7469 [Phialemonium thermophilum]|uniref:Uncharacterized protein n=1 Tax=Phialemonium thermophilum TaxID=223376 RepID=A0ABR3XSU4_9PEZI